MGSNAALIASTALVLASPTSLLGFVEFDAPSEVAEATRDYMLLQENPYSLLIAGISVSRDSMIALDSVSAVPFLVILKASGTF